MSGFVLLAFVFHLCVLSVLCLMLDLECSFHLPSLGCLVRLASDRLQLSRSLSKTFSISLHGQVEFAEDYVGLSSRWSVVALHVSTAPLKRHPLKQEFDINGAM